MRCDRQIARIFEWHGGFGAMYLIGIGLQGDLCKALRELADREDIADATR